jgi:enediyne polyketide synthase
MKAADGGVAVLALACRFPDADSPEALWRNAIDGRRSFRPIPTERLDLAAYAPGMVGPADDAPPVLAGLLTDWKFDRARFRIPIATHDVTDPVHWLALETVADAVERIGGVDALPKDRTAVIFGNTLTGEISRSAVLRLRLPYLRRRLIEAAAVTGAGAAASAALVDAFTTRLAADFPDPNEESLAGGLANTIAGRIANYFDLHGGAWTVDGACASSLLAVSDACGRIASGEIDAAIVGGVDMSLDPFELVGFARAGALARGEMRVFDRRAEGFWPGEGCGAAVLASGSLAARLGAAPAVWLTGWGVSTDGAGGLTRPTEAGQRRALDRAWARSGASPAQAGYLEAHGTGTAVGDPTEIRALAGIVGSVSRPIPVGSIKANIGHTKAAAGMAGMIRAAMALTEGAIPPHVGCDEPHGVFAETGHRLAPARAAEWEGQRLAGVSGFGFGGVNAHLVLRGTLPARVRTSRPAPLRPQDAELFLFAADDAAGLDAVLAEVEARAAGLSLTELAEAAAACAKAADPRGLWRVALVASRAGELAASLAETRAAVTAGRIAPSGAPPRLGFLFPGQAAPVRPGGGAWRRRFPEACIGVDAFAVHSDGSGTAAAQPAIIAASMLAMELARRAGLKAEVALGHSLGEIAALAWGGALSPEEAVGLATERGAIMAREGAPDGGMARVPLAAPDAAMRGAAFGLVLACENGPDETVLAGPLTGVAALVTTTPGASRLEVSHAFHSPAMGAATASFSTALAKRPPRMLARDGMISTVTGAPVPRRTDPVALLVRQIEAPVRFSQALAAADCDLFLELGPGAGLTRLAQAAGRAALSVDAGAEKLRPLLDVLAELWRRGVDVETGWLYADRPLRSFDFSHVPKYISNPCGRPTTDALLPAPAPRPPSAPSMAVMSETGEAALAAVRRITAREVGLPPEAISTEARLLDDLHLNSLSAARIVNAAAAAIGAAPPQAATDLANATLAEIAEHLEELRTLGLTGAPEDRLEGVAPWLAEFETRWQPAAPSRGEPVRWEAGPDGPAEGVLLRFDGHELDPHAPATARRLWAEVKAARAAGAAHLAVLHRGMGLGGFARTLALERVFRSVVLIDVALCSDAMPAVKSLIARRMPGVTELRLDAEGRALSPVLVRVESAPAPGALGPDDLVLVTGGARGIAAECALRIGAATGARLILAGRSPADAPEPTATLARAAEMGVRTQYLSLDLADPAAVGPVLARVQKQAGSITALIHAAGVNRPALFDDLNDTALDAALGPKLGGLDATLGALDPDRLRLLIGFGSVIGQFGLAGEAHYALANGMMSARIEALGKERPRLRALALDWSIWAGAGMGERLGVVERLRRDGVEAIPLASALDRFERLALADATGARVVTGRCGPPPWVSFAGPEVPALRFLDTIRMHQPGVEIVAEARLVPGSDPWLDDHIVDGLRVVPGVMLLEAMAQVSAALTNEPPGLIENLAFSRAVSVADGEAIILRVAGLCQADGTVEVVVRASDDGFATDRARATLSAGGDPIGVGAPAVVTDDLSAEPLYAAGLFFNSGRFRVIETFERLSAFDLAVRLKSVGPLPWFGPYYSSTLLLGDPALRDGGLHALQAAAPQRRILPVAVKRIEIIEPAVPRARMEAVEIAASGDRFVFDIVFRDTAGRAVERWQGAEFRAIAPRAIKTTPQALLAVTLERAAALAHGQRPLRAAMGSGADRADARANALSRLGIAAPARRGDGAPVPAQGSLSLAHAPGVTLAVYGARTVACDLLFDDLEMLAALSSADRKLAASGLPPPVIWAARECLRKAGITADLRRLPPGADGTESFAAGNATVICLACEGLYAAVLTEPARAVVGKEPAHA